MADEPIESLGGKTPLAYAKTPAILHHPAQNIILWKILADCLRQYIMRRHKFHDLSLIPDQAMPVTSSYIELVRLILQLISHRIQSLGGKTPLAYAKTPAMDELSGKSEIGMVHTIPEGMKPGSDTANLSVLGYDPKKYYSGRSPYSPVISAPTSSTAPNACIAASFFPSSTRTMRSRWAVL